MSKMVYKYQDYHFESEDNSILLDPDDYSKFVEKCQKFVEEQRILESAHYAKEAAKRQAARDKLTGKSK